MRPLPSVAAAAAAVAVAAAAAAVAPLASLLAASLLAAALLVESAFQMASPASVAVVVALQGGRQSTCAKTTGELARCGEWSDSCAKVGGATRAWKGREK